MSTFVLRGPSTARLDLKSSRLLNTSRIAASSVEKDIQTSRGLALKFSFSLPSEIFVLKTSADDQYLLAGLADGDIKIYQWKTGAFLTTLSTNDQVPCTNIAVMPEDGSSTYKYILAATYADGAVRFWHIISGSLLSTVEPEPKSDVQALCVDYTINAKHIAVSGTDKIISIYDNMNGKLVQQMSLRTDDEPGHSNRVFSLKCHPLDENVIVSGGWDSTLQIWDRRAKASVGSIMGPHICGESLDLHPGGDLILTGSYVKRNPLQLWSLKKMALVENIKWSLSEDSNPLSTTLLYSASYSKNGNFILACGDSCNTAKVFRADTKRCVATLTKASSALYSACMNKSCDFMACGGGSRELMLFNFDPTSISDFTH